MFVLAISGSLRSGSHNTRLLEATRQLLPAGAELEVFSRLAEIPPYSEDAEHEMPPAVAALKAAIAGADAVLIATPEYNGSIPGQLKNALDWASTPFPDNVFKGKPVAVIGASTGNYGGIWAQNELKKVLGVTGARVVGEGMAVARANEQFDTDGNLADGQAERLAKVLDDLTQEYAAIAA